MAVLPYYAHPGPGTGSLPPRASFESDRPEVRLDGSWGFRWSPSIAQSAADPVNELFPDTVAVPGHWMLDAANGPLVLGEQNRFGSPWYTNVQYPFPLDPPFVPDANGTGDYLRKFDLQGTALAEAGAMEAVLLRFEGVESTFKVWLNGVELGDASGSRLTHEFDATGYLQPTGNRLVVRVHQFSAASYLEDQDQWWLPGIIRPVTLVGQPRRGIRNLLAETGYDAGTGTLTLRAEAAPEAYPLTAEIVELGLRVQLSSPEPHTVAVEGADPWTAETPRLYELSVQSPGERARVRVGFRTVEATGGRLLVNGVPVRLKGVNRHEFNPRTGRAVTEEFSRAELESMKRHNINAIRTSHYPPASHLLDLADELGFWVIDECDLETHGFVFTEWQDNPADSPLWAGALMDRIQRTWTRDANHPSIIMFSLGNESGTGRNLAAMANWLRTADPGRPIHYEGDRTCEYTDVYSRMYPTVQECRSIAAGNPIPGMEPAAAARVASKPFLLCEYAHAMGNGPGGLAAYDELMETYPRFAGGFVWEWKDHGLAAYTSDGRDAVAYGGDFREPVHDGNFVLDGLAFADGTPSPGLVELAKVFEPFRVAVGEHTVGVTNRQDFAGSDGYDFAWEVRDGEGKVLAGGSLALPGVGARDHLEVPLPPEAVDAMALPPASGAALRVSVHASGPLAWAAPGHCVAWGQRVLADAPGVEAGSGESKPGHNAGGTLHLGPNGLLETLSGIPLAGPVLLPWRAPTDNDRGTIEPNRELRTEQPEGFDWDGYAGTAPGPVTALADHWEAARLDRLSRRTDDLQRPDGSTAAVTHRYAPPSGKGGFSVSLEWTAHSDGLILDARVASLTDWGFPLARLGLEFTLPAELIADAAAVRWLGLGPGEAYPDSRSAQHWAVHELPAAALGTRYPRPQENGRRGNVRWLEAGLSDGRRLRVELLQAPPEAGFTLLPYSAAELAAAAHDAELPPSSHWHLVLDAGAHGLGSRSCGIDVLPEDTYSDVSARLRIRLAVLGNTMEGNREP
ncbi:glycoside hydrolase family 2 TIM barrel-domain containing protein [Arthrobacter koreensis]|uniref:glycoside hydrolase family 2 TIM barrel-domain containing protein n=1 Tax=Arthrobacter koreensis TaxID=199136 RepID=UPI002DBC345B|nr:glycoside hydrolase family 2 TIM barrel-domain containing protein [Arthrobacter koreensis]MEB7504868.1 DUF4981 domain-containing protein [Arthrobacter koreensis]